MQLIPQADWRDTTRPSHAPARTSPPPGVEFHHTGGRRAKTRAELIAVAQSIYDDHVHRRGWRDIFYGILLGDHHALDARGIGRLTANDPPVPDLVVSFVGNYEHDHPTVDQLHNAAQARRLVVDHGGGTRVRKHNQRAETDCPGLHIIRALPTIPIAGQAPLAGFPPLKIPPPAPDYPGLATLGHRGRHVSTWQRVLNQRGAHLAVDGRYGPKTRRAVLDWQNRHHPPLERDGKAGPDTWHSLLYAA